MTYPTGDSANLASALGGLLLAPQTRVIVVDTFSGSDSGPGTLNQPYSTMAKALSAATTGCVIAFQGDVREEIVGSNLVFDVTIVGLGGRHHADLASATTRPGASMWRPPASPTTATPLLEVRGRGWRFINVAFDCPVDSAAVMLKRNALEGTAEYDASHALFQGCTFRQGKYGIQDVGGCHNVVIENCEFFQLSDTGGIAITCTSTAVANPLKWNISRCVFPSAVSTAGNLQHIVGAFNAAIVQHCVFGTVVSTAIYINFTGGNSNIVVDNILGGAYDTSDYVSGTGDIWLRNMVAVKATTAPDGVTLVAPGAP